MTQRSRTIAVLLLTTTTLTGCARYSLQPPKYGAGNYFTEDTLCTDTKPASVNPSLEQVRCRLGKSYNELVDNRDSFWNTTTAFDLPIIALALSTAGLLILGGDNADILGLEVDDLGFIAASLGVLREYAKPENVQMAFDKAISGYQCLLSASQNVLVGKTDLASHKGDQKLSEYVGIMAKVNAKAALDTNDRKLFALTTRRDAAADADKAAIQIEIDELHDRRELLLRATEAIDEASTAIANRKEQDMAAAAAANKLLEATSKMIENARRLAETGDINFNSIVSSLQQTVQTREAFTQAQEQAANSATPGPESAAKNITRFRNTAESRGLAATAIPIGDYISAIIDLEQATYAYVASMPDVKTAVTSFEQCAALVPAPEVPS